MRRYPLCRFICARGCRARERRRGHFQENTAESTAFEMTSKRRKGFLSQIQLKRGEQLVHGEKELVRS